MLGKRTKDEDRIRSLKEMEAIIPPTRVPRKEEIEEKGLRTPQYSPCLCFGIPSMYKLFIKP